MFVTELTETHIDRKRKSRDLPLFILWHVFSKQEL
jgi:hypothetical protein